MREAEEEGGRKGSKMGQCVWLLMGSPAGWGRGTGQPGGGSSSTLTQSSPFTGPVAQGSQCYKYYTAQYWHFDTSTATQKRLFRNCGLVTPSYSLNVCLDYQVFGKCTNTYQVIHEQHEQNIINLILVKFTPY